jgi:hypothetical protein
VGANYWHGGGKWFRRERFESFDETRRLQRSSLVPQSLGEGGSQTIEMRNRKSFFTTLL